MSEEVDQSAAWQDEDEPWESWETRLCLWSVGIGIAGLVVMGTLVNLFLL